MPQQQWDATHTAATFGRTCYSDPTDVPYQGDEAQNMSYATNS